MKMELRDISGSLYSSPHPSGKVVGIWFGGFQTADFLDATESLEEKRPGAREEIIAEAHYLVLWLHEFPNIGFLFGIILGTGLDNYLISLLLALLISAGCYMIESIRFYMFGASPLLSQLCRAWRWIKIPAFIIAAISLWPEDNFLSITLIVFLIVLSVVMLPIKAISGRIIQIIFSEKLENLYGSDWYKMTALAMDFVINRWRLKLLPADRFNIDQ